MNIGTANALFSFASQTGLRACELIGLVVSPGPGRRIGGRKERADFRLGQEGYELLVKAPGRKVGSLKALIAIAS